MEHLADIFRKAVNCKTYDILQPSAQESPDSAGGSGAGARNIKLHEKSVVVSSLSIPAYHACALYRMWYGITVTFQQKQANDRAGSSSKSRVLHLLNVTLYVITCVYLY